MQEAARSRYNDVLDFDSSSAILKIEWREEDLGFTAHVQPFLSPVDPGTQQNHVTKISNEDGNVFKMAAKAK